MGGAGRRRGRDRDAARYGTRDARARLDQSTTEAQRAREAEERDRERAQRDRDRVQRDRERTEALYDSGQDALSDGQWTRAIERFTKVVAANAGRADAAMYWTAYAQSKLGQQSDALATLGELTKTYPSSRWVGDARALDIEVRRSVGQPVRPEAQADEELKLLAIQGLQHSDAAQAVPMLEKFLQGPQSPKLKERALFVLAQINSPQARQVLAGIAKGATQPDLQRRAIQYLGVNATQDNRALLAEIYTSATDVSVKRQVLRAYMVAGDRARVLAAATSEPSPELRQEAVRQLGVMGAREELRQLYQKESDVDVKRQILQALFVAGDSERLVELANGETNPQLRLAAVRHLGTMSSQRIGPGPGHALRARWRRGGEARGHQRPVRAGQRRGAGRPGPQGVEPGAEAGDRAEALGDEVEGGDRLPDGDSRQMSARPIALRRRPARGRDCRTAPGDRRPRRRPAGAPGQRFGHGAAAGRSARPDARPAGHGIGRGAVGGLRGAGTAW